LYGERLERLTLNKGKREKATPRKRTSDRPTEERRKRQKDHRAEKKKKRGRSPHDRAFKGKGGGKGEPGRFSQIGKKRFTRAQQRCRYRGGKRRNLSQQKKKEKILPHHFRGEKKGEGKAAGESKRVQLLSERGKKRRAAFLSLGRLRKKGKASV